MRYILLILFLTGCAVMHEPDLIEPPKDPEKYQSDLKFCKDEATKRFRAAQDNHSSLGADMFGLAGAIATQPKYDPNDDYFKNNSQMTDECMSAKGYKLAS